MTQPVPFQLPQYVIDRVMKKRGRLRVFDRFEAHESALVVVDMQEFYVRDVPSAVAIIPNINRLARAFRERGGHVAWVNMVAGEDGRSLWPLYHDHFFTPENARRHRDNLSLGHPGQALHADLEALPQDIQARKQRFSAFIPQHSDLPRQLQARGIRNVAIVGMLTNFCCETSARDAMMLDYRVSMVSDANAARFEDDHNVGFQTVFQSFGDVVTVADMLDEILVPASAGAPGARGRPAFGSDDDAREIEWLQRRYAQLNDAADWPAVAALFTESATFSRPSAPTQPIVGRAAILQSLQSRAHQPGRRHLVANPQVEWIDIDTARASCESILLVEGGDGAGTVSIGGFHDELLRTRAGWRFQSRTGFTRIDAAPFRKAAAG